MSRGPGRVQTLVLTLIRDNPEWAWTIEEITMLAYPGINRAEKKHRVAAIRALNKMTLPGTWATYRMRRSGTAYCLHDPCNLQSAIRYRWLEGWADIADRWPFESFEKDRPYIIDDVRQRVKKAQQYRDADEIGKVDIQIANAQNIMNLIAMAGGNREDMSDRIEHIAKLQDHRSKLVAAREANSKDVSVSCARNGGQGQHLAGPVRNCQPRRSAAPIRSRKQEQ